MHIYVCMHMCITCGAQVEARGASACIRMHMGVRPYVRVHARHLEDLAVRLQQVDERQRDDLSAARSCEDAARVQRVCSTHAVCTQCARSVLAVCTQCARSVHAVCTQHTRGVSAAHLQCTWGAHALPLRAPAPRPWCAHRAQRAASLPRCGASPRAHPHARRARAQPVRRPGRG